MSTVITCALMLERDGKLLLVQEAAEEVYGRWNQPAGHLEAGETIIDCARREAREESGYEIDLIGLQAIYDYTTSAGRHIVNFCFRARPIGEPGPIAEQEILTTRWFTSEELRRLPDGQLRHALTRRRIDDWLAGKSVPLDVLVEWSMP